MSSFKKILAIGAVVLGLSTPIVPANAFPYGFYVRENNHRNHIVYQRDTQDGPVVVTINEYSLRGINFKNLVDATSRANGADSCTKMKNMTPIGGPRFHCQHNINHYPYTLHLVPYYRDNIYLQIIIYGPGYPGFGINYDDVKDMIFYWFRQ